MIPFLRIVRRECDFRAKFGLDMTLPTSVSELLTLQSVAGRTRRLHPCETRREADRQQIRAPLCYPRLTTMLLGAIGPSLAPAHFPTPLRAGANDCFDEGARSTC